ncbi:AI-2E family transporter [Telmatospirillum sp.]|uniref:AI-2E family transporter n=1 Tax=Telmatospirillum sp. TaxID=2079197 RepID=UPI00285152EF|nr:AI-2E family transporter [Telmatospirillum sp.]MDR3438444.1 AI-2E family transporter [Telmatospirillum sp.]
MSLSRENKLRFWLIGLAVFVLLLYLLRSILLPFVAGMAVAYLLDPLAHRLERIGLSRTVATVVITLFFFVAVVLFALLVTPLVEDQVVGFAQRVPGYVHQLVNRGAPLWRTAQTYLSVKDIEQLRTAGGEYAGTLATWLAGFVSRLLTGSLVVVNVLSLVFITPVVTFYLLRDWEGITRRVDSWLPRVQAATIREQLRQIDRTLAGFVRGQALVCVALGAFYGIGLTAVGLDLGLVVGFSAGLGSFIPYLGTISGFVVGMGLAIAQSPDWTLAGMVAGVFLVGNLLESYVLAPKLVGEKIGLHPVWVIFALLAGGALFGFLGILLALPVTAVIGVLIRFGLGRYLESSLYRGDSGEGGGSL